MKNKTKQLQKSGDILFKYRSMATETERNRTLDILDSRRLYCSAPITFNDPFECIAEISFIARPEVKTRRAIKQLMKKNPCMSKKEAKLKAPNLWQQLENNGIKEFFRWLQYNTGVVSFSEIKDDILMWSHYAGRHDGVCIEFSCTDENHIAFFAQIQQVQYQEKLPSVNFYTTSIVEKAQAYILTKAKHWEYEREWRRVVTDSSKYIVLPSRIISAIYLGCRISEENRNEILRRVDSISSHGNVRLFQAKPRSDAYALDFELINK